MVERGASFALMRTGALALVATAGVLLAASLLFGGGSNEEPVAWIGSGAVLVATGASAAVLWGLLPAPWLGREGVVFAGLVAGFVAWNGISIIWSAAPDRSWSYFNRGLIYIAFAVVGAFVGSALSVRVVAWLVGGLVAVTCFWALAGKVVPDLYDDYGRFARLRSPVGYWNALALVAVFGMPVALWAATRRGHSRAVRAAAVVVLYGLVVALVLTYSRGGVLAALVALGLWLWLSGERFESATAMVVAAVPAAAVLAVGLSLPGIAQDGQPHSVRAHDGVVFAVVFLLGAGLAFGGSYLLRYRPGPEQQRRLLQAAAGVTALALVVGAAALVWQGKPLGGGEAVRQDPGHLLSGSSNNRWDWWKEAWKAFEGEPLVGTGAGSFEIVHRNLRTSKVNVREVHNLPLQFAAELGIVGFLLAAGAAGAALLGAWRALERLDGDDRAAAVALGVVLPTFLVHSVLDYDWEFVALCGPVFFVTGVLLVAGIAPRPVSRRPVWAVATVLVAWAALYSVAAPRVAAGRVDKAYAQIERGSADDAAASAKTAHSLDPLSIGPLQAWAAAEEARGRIARARELYARAVELEPLNWFTWYELGRFDRDVLGDDAAAGRELRRALELDPYGCPPRQALGKPC